ncbi:MAG: insulinase family protein [Candidatus Zixiibacteriota bacterium]|nr:MAG: insulinase family protein [candidate division Zixibacteria bacterium]
MKFHRILIFTFCLLVATALPVRAASIDLDIQKTVLDNGLTILTCEDHSVRTVSYQTFMDVGSRDEVKPGITGLAHVFEHMMFRGTEKYPDYDEAIGHFGPETNAYTGEDRTVYFVNVKAEYLEKVIEVEADRVRNLIFNDQTFRTELGPVKEERRMGEVEDPDGFLWSEFTQLAYKKHTYGHSVIGFEEDLEKNIQLEDGLEFKRTFYSPGYATIVVAGNFDTPQVIEWIRTYYADWEKQPPQNIPIPVEPPQTEERISEYFWKDNLITPKLIIGYHGPEFDIMSDDFCALSLIGEILFLKSGRLTKRLYTDLQMVDYISGRMQSQKDPGMFTVSTNLKKGKSIQVVKDIVFEEIDKLTREKVSEDELTKAKNSVKASMFYRLNRPFSVASLIGRYHLLAGDYNMLFQIEDRYGSITPEIIQQVAEKTFKPTNRTVVSLVPRG